MREHSREAAVYDEFGMRNFCILSARSTAVQSFGALAQSTNSPLVRILPSDFKSLRLREWHA